MEGGGPGAVTSAAPRRHARLQRRVPGSGLSPGCVGSEPPHFPFPFEFASRKMSRRPVACNAGFLPPGSHGVLKSLLETPMKLPLHHEGLCLCVTEATADPNRVCAAGSRPQTCVSPAVESLSGQVRARCVIL